jgi:light-regulated signal transduction histidine kinase (bacteriophytochrome)
MVSDAPDLPGDSSSSHGAPDPLPGDLARAVAAMFSPLAHDLRAGLNGISVWTHLLQRDGDEVAVRAVEGIRRAVAQQSALAQELSQIGAALVALRGPPTEPIDLRALSTQVVDEIRMQDEGAHLRIEGEHVLSVRSHADVLRRIVRLIVLDVLATVPGAPVTLALRQTGRDVVLEVSAAAGRGTDGASAPRRTLRQSLAALAACMVEARLQIDMQPPAVRCVLTLPSAV